MYRLIAVMVLLFAGIAQASTVTVDFEDSSGPLVSVGSDTITNQGVQIYASGFAVSDGPQQGQILNPGSYGSKSLYIEACCVSQDGFSPNVTLTITKEGGGSFSLLDMDYGIVELFAPPLGAAYSGISGAMTAGGTVTDTTAFGTGGWLDVTSVTLYSDGDGFFASGTASIEVDNIVVGAAVPVPAAIWLFGSALAGLGWTRRKQKS